MKYAKSLAAALAAFLVTGAAHAQSSLPSAMEGRPVYAQDGSVLGYVERVIMRKDGRPGQVLVRPKGPKPAAGPRSLSFASLKAEGDGFTAPVTQAEFNAMPAVEVAPK